MLYKLQYCSLKYFLIVLPVGYTLSFWVNFVRPDSLLDVSSDEFVYMSNGGHSNISHGVAMLYNGRGRLEMRFKQKDGKEWRVKAEDVLPSKWYHMAASWDARDGLTLYVNGDRADTDILPHVRSARAAGGPAALNDFVIGRANDATWVLEKHTMLIDEFNFWSMAKNLSEIREAGE